MKKILVPTDFSECARAAEDTAIEIAKKAGAEIHFLHTIYTPVDWTKISLKKENLYPETKKQIGLAKNELSKLVRRCDKLGITAREFLAFDKGREEITRHTMEYNHDFIIMGTFGDKGVKKIIGSNTQKVIRYSKVPVLSLKRKFKKNEIKNIVFASDFEEDAQKAFQKMVDFAEIMDASIHLLYINTPNYFKETDEIWNNIKAFIKKTTLSSYTLNIYNALNVERGILKFSNSIGADLSALVTHGRTGVMNMISPSIAEELVNHSDIPIISINLNAK